MKTASRMLGTAFFLEGFEVQDAPRYGAERRGAPIFAYVRAARTPINERGVVRRPDLVIVADDSLVGVPAAGACSFSASGVIDAMSMPSRLLATLFTRTLTAHCGSHGSFGSAGRGGWARFSSAP